MQQIVVLGAGAIGSLYAAKLSTSRRVTIVGREQHVAAIQEHGLRIVGLTPEVYRVTAVPRLDRVEPDTLLLVTTKVPDNASALQSVASLLRRDTVVLCLQNGLHGEEIIRRLVGRDVLVLRGLTQCGAIFRAPGVIELKATGITLLEPSPASEAIAHLFSECGLEGRVSESIRTEVWRKLICNCVINPITSITGREVGSIADPRLDPLKRLVISECLEVAAAEGVHVDGDMMAFINDTFGPSPNRASMLQDLERGRRTEIDFMNGAVVDLGESHGIACPANRTLTTLIRCLEHQSIEPVQAARQGAGIPLSDAGWEKIGTAE